MKFLWTAIYVKNLDKSIVFYSNLIGFQVLKRFTAKPGMEIAFMGNGNDNETQIELLADSTINQVKYSEYISIGFAVDSLDTMLNEINRWGIPIQSGPMETPGAKFFYIKDPDGVLVQFFQKK